MSETYENRRYIRINDYIYFLDQIGWILVGKICYSFGNYEYIEWYE